jgi:hypothetical protein
MSGTVNKVAILYAELPTMGLGATPYLGLKLTKSGPVLIKSYQFFKKLGYQWIITIL